MVHVSIRGSFKNPSFTPKRSIIPPVTLRKHLDFRAERPCLLPWGRRQDSSPSDEWMMDGQIECLQPHHSDDMNNSDGGKWLVVQKLALKSLLMFLLCWETWKKGLQPPATCVAYLAYYWSIFFKHLYFTCVFPFCVLCVFPFLVTFYNYSLHFYTNICKTSQLLLCLKIFKRFTYFCCNSSCCLKWSLNLVLNSTVLSLNIKLDGILKGDHFGVPLRSLFSFQLRREK